MLPVAEIDTQNETLILCDSVPADLMILNFNEIIDLIVASHYLINLPFTWIADICAQTIFFKQPFLEGIYINDHVFGCLARLVVPNPQKDISQSNYEVELVLCDIHTQSNFLWNKKPLTIQVKALVSDGFSNMPYERMELQPMNDHFLESGGIRFGDKIMYDGPFDIIFD